jgi:hypothetical protein
MICFRQHVCQGKLYVILPYFNFCGFKRREKLFLEFVERIIKYPVRIVIVSAGGLPHCLPVFKHIEVGYRDQMWVKENLINIAIRRLPKNWKYVAWIDADITFLNEKWVQDTIDELETFDIVQLFHTAAHLGSTQEITKVDKSFGYMHTKSGQEYSKTDKYGFWHPGFAWACTKKAYQKMGGLLDWAILGSGDRHLALALIGKVEWSAPGNISDTYLQLLRNFQKACKGLTLSYIPGTILHHWHGSLENRKYRERWDILTSNKFDPVMDLDYTSQGLIHFTDNGRRLIYDVSKYFMDRREDD